MKATVRFIFFFILTLVIPSLHAQLQVVGLRVEHMHNPSVVDTWQPRFSWVNEVLDREEKGQRQTAYQIVVSSSRKNLARGRYDVWDSGKVQRDESNLIPYNGLPLQEAADYFWKVRTWDKNGKPSAWSQTGTWCMGIRNANWKARWIAEDRVEDGFNGLLLRRSVRIDKKVASAKVFVCGLGFFELYLNGKRVGDDYLVPNISNYTKRHDLQNFAIKLDGNFTDYRCLYMAYDVTDAVLRGDNMLGVMLGNGWFHPEPGRASIFGGKCLRLQLMITYKDGSTEVICSDREWQTHSSAILYSGIYGGELYDARQEIAGWSLPGADSAGWQNANEIEGPVGQMSAMTSPPDKITEVLKPQSIIRLDSGVWEVDFGKEISGWIHFTGLEGQSGDTLQVDYVCESPQGNQRYIFSGKGGEECRPYFTWFVFSKARIKGVADLKAENLVAEAVNTDVPLIAEFRTSNSLFNRINDIWQRSQLDNMHGCIASDCPHREKLPYTGDGQAAAETVMHNFDAAAFYQKWIRDMRDSQNRETGHVPNSAPWQPGAGGGVAWGAAMTLMPWWFYEQYADARLLEESYPSMKAQVNYMLSWVNDDGIMHQKMLNHGTQELCYWLNLGDWVAPGEMPRDELVHTFYLWLCCDYCSKAAHALGQEDEAALYSSKAQEVASAFHRHFYNAEGKTYGLGGSNIYALRMGVPEERKADVVATLRREIMEDNGGCLNTGFVATKYFFETLTDCGLGDVAYAVMNSRRQPSYGWWIEQGASVTWEQWDGGNSHNHPMFGGGLTWFYRCLAGVRADDSAPGYRHIIIRPMLTELEEVRYSRQTPYGLLETEITTKESGRHIRVTVPVGCTATLYLPSCVRELEQGSYTFCF